MSRRFVNRLVNGKKTSTLVCHAGAGNPNIPHIFDLDGIREYVRKHSTLADNGECMIWNGSYARGGMANPQIAVRGDDGQAVPRPIRRAYYSAKIGRDIINEPIRIMEPTCGYADCVNPDHASFECISTSPTMNNKIIHKTIRGAGGDPNKPVKWW